MGFSWYEGMSRAGVPTPALWTSVSLRPSQEPDCTAGGERLVSEQNFMYVYRSLHRSQCRLSSASVGSVAALDSHRSANPTVNCECEDLGCVLLIRIIPKPSPPALQSVEKLSSMKPVPSARKVGDHWSREVPDKV